jgi:hypothetical protein
LEEDWFIASNTSWDRQTAILLSGAEATEAVGAVVVDVMTPLDETETETSKQN